MHTLKFNSFELHPTDFALGSNLLAFDIKFDSKKSFDVFDSFYVNHIEDKDYFEYEIDDIVYQGRFGALIYDLEYNARFYMTISPDRESYSSCMSVLQYNLPGVLQNHEKRLSLLTKLLYEKNILNADEVNLLSSYLTPIDDKGIDIQRQVKNLESYLTLTESTLDDIRNESI